MIQPCFITLRRKQTPYKPTFWTSIPWGGRANSTALNDCQQSLQKEGAVASRPGHLNLNCLTIRAFAFCWYMSGGEHIQMRGRAGHGKKNNKCYVISRTSGLQHCDESSFLCRCMSSGEYIQMSGRAGRRGKDDKGMCIMMIDDQMTADICRCRPSLGAHLRHSCCARSLHFCPISLRDTCWHRVGATT